MPKFFKSNRYTIFLYVVDIDDLKRDITQLESKIKSFKQYIRSELRTLQFEENVIKEKVI